MESLLIADSGSTKTEWNFISPQKSISSFITQGVNPYYMQADEIVQVIGLAKDYLFVQHQYPDVIYFYGAGASYHKKIVLEEAIHQIFPIHNIFVDSDLLGAARALCGTHPGIACILGTGSNSCYYNGKNIESHVSPLGLLLGDEGSGASIGKKLISDILKNQLPKQVIDAFHEKYKVTIVEILDEVYRKPLPNRYLARFASFVSENLHIKELESLVLKSFEEFIVRNICQYEQSVFLKINFTGSIAFVFKKQLEIAVTKYGLQMGKITQSPMEDLVNYHLLNS